MKVTYHLWQTTTDWRGRDVMREANYGGYRPMPASEIVIENDMEIIYFAQATGRRKNTIVAAEKRINGVRAEFVLIDGNPRRVSAGIQPRLTMTGGRIYKSKGGYDAAHDPAAA